MKKIFLFLIVLTVTFSACKKNDFQTESAEDVVAFTTWKEVDTTQDKYVLHRFNGAVYTKEFYATKNFKELVDVHSGEIMKSEGDHLLISMDDGGLYDCSVCPSSDKSSITFACTPKNGVGEESCLTLWRYR